MSMKEFALLNSAAFTFSLFGVKNSSRCVKYFSISRLEVRVLPPGLYISEATDFDRTLWVSIKLAFALDLQSNDSVRCTFGVVGCDGVILERTLFINILPASCDSRHVYINHLCFFNLTRGIGSSTVSLTLKDCRRSDGSPIPAQCAEISVIKTALSDDIDVDDDVVKDYFFVQRLLRVGDVFLLDGFDKKRHCISKIPLKVMSLEGPRNSGDAVISVTNTAVFQVASVCDYVPTLSKLAFLSPSLEQLCKKIYILIKAQHDCEDTNSLSIFLYGQPGAGQRQILVNLGALLFVNVLFFNCLDCWSEASGQSITKIKAFFRNVGEFDGYCIVVFENADTIGYIPNTETRDRQILDCFESCLNKFQAYCFVFTCEAESSSVSSLQLLLSLYNFTIPSLKLDDRIEIISKTLPFLSLENVALIAQKTDGFLFSELESIADDALFDHRLANENTPFMEHVENAIKLRNKTLSRSLGVPKISELTWNDIGGLEDAKKALRESMEVLVGEKGFKRSGIILHGPPGCGKTLLAKAVANQYMFPLVSVKGPELLDKYVGESEANVRRIFEKARRNAPCIIFFDELDSIASKRGRSGDSGGVADRIVSQLLTEMDEITDEKVFILGATNRLDLLDSSLLTPGRFDKTILIDGGKSIASRLAILEAASRRVKFTEDVDLREIAQLCDDWVSGADLHSVVSKAMLNAMRECIKRIEVGSATEFEPILVSRKNMLYGLEMLQKSSNRESPSV